MKVMESVLHQHTKEKSCITYNNRLLSSCMVRCFKIEGFFLM